jgi:hypothetical protein
MNEKKKRGEEPKVELELAKLEDLLREEYYAKAFEEELQRMRHESLLEIVHSPVKLKGFKEKWHRWRNPDTIVTARTIQTDPELNPELGPKAARIHWSREKQKDEREIIEED